MFSFGNSVAERHTVFGWGVREPPSSLIFLGPEFINGDRLLCQRIIMKTFWSGVNIFMT